ncbi:glycosyltransferase family 4 protein [Aestuariicoccus sp. MJ-SS9]|uniref:glycosyltransferase family 4 protein n=1 Tax=Aestuariicoccus sp. MJ-SS9 TaxID=3079855 RepID=UPI0029088A39|nr:glycosyltransferase family 4 protein [Aestuariicoccus sp. MJ-SS9]MDU8913284.1 glycosyltransferase family 4 protein [Aestuariicoccus sp. MJ-SS9]
MQRGLNLSFPMIRTGTGAEIWTRRLAELLARRGHSVTLSEIAHGFQYAPWLAPVSIPPETDAVIANSWTAAAFARRGVPLVSVCHLVVQDPVLSPFKSFAQSQFHAHFVTPMERAAARRAQINVAVSHYVARSMRDLLGINGVTVIENAVDTEFFAPSQTPRDSSGPIRLLFVGKPSRRKGIDLIARVMAELGTRVQLTFVGPSPEPSDIPSGATFTGSRDRAGVRDAYREADLLLFPSRAEGFGLAAAEALSCGLPVVCTEGTAVSEIVNPSCAISCRAEDVSGFATEILRLAGDRPRLRQMRQAAREHALVRFDERRWVAAFETLLYDLQCWSPGV